MEESRNAVSYEDMTKEQLCELCASQARTIQESQEAVKELTAQLQAEHSALESSRRETASERDSWYKQYDANNRIKEQIRSISVLLDLIVGK